MLAKDVMTQITFNDQELNQELEYELLPQKGSVLYVELVGKWLDGSPLHQICTCATEVHINYQLGYGFHQNIPMVAVECDVLKTGSIYFLSQLTKIIIKEVPFGFFDVK